MSEEFTREDLAIEAAMSRCLEQGDVMDPLEPGDVADEALIREYTELLGLLPHELEPVAPKLSTKVRLLAVVGGEAGASGTMSPRSASPPARSRVVEETPQRSVEELTFQTASVGEGAASPVETVERRSPVDVTLRHSTEDEPRSGVVPSSEGSTHGHLRAVPAAAPVEAVDSAPRPEALQPLPARPSTPWTQWAMAAMLALCMLGMGYLVGQSREQQVTIARLQDDLQRSALVSTEEDPGLSELLSDLNLTKKRLRMVTEIARSAYPMRTVSNVASAQRPDGMIYVCGQHQRWYLNVQGLEPPMPGKEYRLWFITDQGTVDGGVLDVEPGALVEKEANSMPMGTRGFSITLEDVAEDLDGPEGLMVLLGEQAVSL